MKLSASTVLANVGKSFLEDKESTVVEEPMIGPVKLKDLRRLISWIVTPDEVPAITARPSLSLLG
jgi:hypothetical protein